MAALILTALGAGPALGQTLVSSFENDLSSSTGTDWGGMWTTAPEFTATGATEGAAAIALHHAPTWVTDGFFLKAGLPLAELTAQNNLLSIDFTTTDLGEAGDGSHPSFRQVFVIFNSNQGGWMQNQVDFGVASDDGGSFTETIVLDLEATGIRANAQAYVDSGGGEGTWWELFLVFQGEDVVAKAGDYNDDNIVNAADYAVWQDNVGGGTLPNETVSIGIVDQEDYAEWTRVFGTEYGAAATITTIVDNVRFANAGSGGGGPVGVPEPSSAVLALAALLALASGRRSRT
jgi:hypothetical protein